MFYFYARVFCHFCYSFWIFDLVPLSFENSLFNTFEVPHLMSGSYLDICKLIIFSITYHINILFTLHVKWTFAPFSLWKAHKKRRNYTILCINNVIFACSSKFQVRFMATLKNILHFCFSLPKNCTGNYIFLSFLSQMCDSPLFVVVVVQYNNISVLYRLSVCKYFVKWNNITRLLRNIHVFTSNPFNINWIDYSSLSLAPAHSLDTVCVCYVCVKARKTQQSVSFSVYLIDAHFPTTTTCTFPLKFVCIYYHLSATWFVLQCTYTQA